MKVAHYPMINLQSAIRNPQSAITAVFVHGAGSSADFWHWQRPVFPHAYFPDLPGHRSHQPSSPADRTTTNHPSSFVISRSSIEDYASWLAHYIESANLHSVVLNGHSMGGAIALTLALDNPPWLRGLILTGTGARLRVSPALLDLLQTDYPAAVEFILEHSFAPPSGPPSYAQKVRLNGTRKQLLRTPADITLADYQACDQFDLTNRISEITLPTLCIVGAQDEMTPPKYSQYLHQSLPHSQLAIIQNAGHMLPLESPDQYNAAITNFLIALEEKGMQEESP